MEGENKKEERRGKKQKTKKLGTVEPQLVLRQEDHSLKPCLDTLQTQGQAGQHSKMDEWLSNTNGHP